jgi:hypothetical protein
MSRSMPSALTNARVHVVAGDRHRTFGSISLPTATRRNIAHLSARRCGNLIALEIRKLFDMRSLTAGPDVSEAE